MKKLLVILSASAFTAYNAYSATTSTMQSSIAKKHEILQSL